MHYIYNLIKKGKDSIFPTTIPKGANDNINGDHVG